MKIEGLILAGGKSRRMGGIHKGNMELGKNTFTEIIWKELKKDCGNINVSYGDVVHDTHKDWGIVKDIYPDCGPIGGLQAGLRACRGDTVFVAACDMPFLQIEFYRYLAQYMEGADAVVPVVNGRLHPLSAVYKSSAHKVFEAQIQKKNYKIICSLEKMRVMYLNLKSDKFAWMMHNINTMEEYQEAKKLFGKRSNICRELRLTRQEISCLKK